MRRVRPGALWLLAVVLPLVWVCPTRADVTTKLELPPLPAAFKKVAPTTLDELKEIQTRTQLVVKKVMPAVVNVKVGGGQGSGVIISEDGYILTAGHVSGIPNQKVEITLADGRKVKGITLGANRMVDSGLIKITDEGKWPVAQKGDSSKLANGDWCVALGHPNGFQKDRDPVVRLGRVLETLSVVIRTDCILVGGDSGGPLFDMDGKVIGIHSRIMFATNLNFHVPVKQFDNDWIRLTKGELVSPAYLGVKRDPNAKDCKLLSVTKDSAADKAGLKADDVITKMDKEKIESFDDLSRILDSKHAGDKVTLEVQRGDAMVNIEVTLGSFPNQKGVPIIAPQPAGWSQIHKFLKDQPETVKVSQPILTKATRSTVQILCGGKQVSLGTIVKADGLILTVASELDGAPTVELPDGRQIEAKVISRDEKYNVALLKIEAQGLMPVEWKNSKNTQVGSWVMSVGTTPYPVALGVLSVGMRKPVYGPPEDKGYLGIEIAPGAAKGVNVGKVTKGTGADKAGMKSGDVIINLAGKEIPNDAALQEVLKDRKKGETLEVKVLRGEKEVELKVTLGPRPPSNGDLQNQMGSKLSKKKSGFPYVLTHDSVIRPEDCGGPLVDLEGKAVGINIARAGRTESFAIPSESILPLLNDMIAGKHVPKTPATGEKTSSTP